MPMKAWLSALQRQLVRGTRNAAGLQARRRERNSDHVSATEQLEERALLTALVINSQNFDDFARQDEGIVVDNADLVGFDSLVIESVAFGGVDTSAIDINLSGIDLNAIAIENVDVADYDGPGISIQLTNVTGLDTIAIEETRVFGDGVGASVSLTNTDVAGLTVDDSDLAGLSIVADAGSDIGHGAITENRLAGGVGVEGINLDLNSGSADDFHILDNTRISSTTSDAVHIDLTDSPQDGLTIRGNTIGASTPVDIEFVVDGDTFSQPFRLTNPATNGEFITRIFMDIEPAFELEFDEDPTTGKPFRALNNSDVVTGLSGAITTPTSIDMQFGGFAPTEEIVWEIDIDQTGGFDAPINGADLIGTQLTFEFDDGKVITGFMVGVPGSSDASQFSQTAGSEGANGINILAVDSPLSDLLIEENTVSGTPGSSLVFNTEERSDVTGLIQNNEFLSSSSDGVVFNLQDSNFQGGFVGNNVSGHDGHGLLFNPLVTRSGRVEDLSEGPADTIVIESINHELQTDDVIILQGLLDDDPEAIFPGNGQFRVIRLTNNTFALKGLTDVDADPRFSDGDYDGGGTWYIPEIDANGFARGLVSFDLQSELPGGFVQDATNTNPVVIRSVAHGLETGDLIRVSNVAGNSAANGIRLVTRLDDDRFQIADIDGNTISGNGAFDADAGLGKWTGNVIVGISDDEDEMIVTAPDHGLVSGETVRITGAQGDDGDLRHSANGTYTIRRIDNDSFKLIGVGSNQPYLDGGSYLPLSQETASGDFLPQMIAGNSFTSNSGAGVQVELTVGTTFDADLTSNQFMQNREPGLHVESESFGVGTQLPLDPTDPSAVPAADDISFDINVGSLNTEDGNVFDRNRDAGIRVLALDSGTGSFEIRNNLITSTISTGDSLFQGDGIHVRLEGGQADAEAASVLAESVIDGNIIGVDAEGNEGRGVVFSMEERTRIQDLEYTNNAVVNNGDDGFRFDRRDDARLNNVRVTRNTFENNAGDGADFVAQNSTRDVLDFRFDENDITNNAHYGIRISVLADARIAVDLENNRIDGNGEDENGFRPADGTNNAGKSGGIGFRGFQNVEIQMNMVGNQINDNRGDGLSIDAVNFFDQLRVTGNWQNNQFNNNDLSGVRANGMAFGTFTWADNEFNSNGEDGLRAITLIDRTDFFLRRVGGSNIDVLATGSEFNGNGSNGLHLGQAFSAVLGDGTSSGSNSFDENGEDGLKVTQGAGLHMFQAGLRRSIVADTNSFVGNGDNGIDLGDDFQTEGSRELHGDEALTQTDVRITTATVVDNLGDGIEYLVDPVPTTPQVIGGGQDDISYYTTARSSLTVRDSSIRRNEGRGIDILNRVEEDSWINIIDNDIVANGLSGVYVLNTASNVQLQDGPDDVLVQELNSAYVIQLDNNEPLVASALTAAPHIEIRIEENEIESNGSDDVQSRVPINSSLGGQDGSGATSTDWSHQTTLVPTSLGGVVFRVGSVNAPAGLLASDPDFELGSLSGVDATVIDNVFEGNFGSEVYFDNFTSVISPQSQSNFHSDDTPCFAWNGSRDAVSRFDLVFVENEGNSLDVINGFAFQDNFESEFKSRTEDQRAPNHTHNNDPYPGDPDAGPHSVQPQAENRRRNSTRTLGWTVDDFWQLGDVVQDWVGPCGFLWGFDGEGTSTWRVEPTVEDDGFSVDETLGESSFATIVELANRADYEGEEHYQWDTGFTPYSLTPGELFNIVDSSDFISPDDFEENDSFRAASYLGFLGQPLSVNDQTANGELSIETKGDRDYYSFDITETGDLNVFLSNDVSATGLTFTIYWIDPDAEVEERAITNPRFVGVGNSSTVQAQIDGSQTETTAIRQLFDHLTEVNENGNRVNDSARIVVEVVGDEFSNLGGFFYGTAENYQLDIDAPGDSSNGFSGGGSSGSGSGSGSGGSGDLILPGPPTADIENVVPSPRSTGVPEVQISFNEDVINVDITDFQLTLDDEVIDISDRSIVEIDPMTYTLDLSGITQEEGQYRLLLRRSDIVDLDGEGLLRNASETWVVDAEVSSTTDFIDSEVGDGQASDDDGNSSLRAAVQEANDIAGEDLIRLPAGTYTLSLDGHFEENSLFGDLNVTDDLRIVGDGAGVTIIDAAQVDRLFHVFPGVTLTLDGVTLANGEAHDGGAIFNEGTLNLIDTNIVDSRAFNQGGGIYNLGTVDLVSSSVVFNTAGSRGGGIYNAGAVTALNTTIAGNSAVSRGAGIFNDGDVDLNSVTVARNTGGARGSGIANGIGVDSEPTLQIANTLVAENSSDFLSPVTGNVFAQDIDGTVDSRGHNLVTFLDSHIDRIAGGYRSTDILGGTADEDPAIDAKLAQVVQANAAGRNGTYRVNLKANSPAIDAGNDSFFPDSVSDLDQIDHPRFLDGDQDADRQIDIGAKERFINRPVPFFTISANPAGVDELVGFDASLSNHTLPDFDIVNWEWDFDYDGVTFDVDATGESVNRRFPTAGEFTIALRVTDNNVPPQTAIRTQTIEIGVTPDQPTPVPFVVTTDSTPVLEWRGGAADFQLQLRRIEEDGSETLIIDQSGIEQNSFTVPLSEQLEPGEKYVFRVRGRNGAGFGAWSEDELFRIREILVRSPLVNEPDPTPVIQWTGVRDTLRYELFIKDTDTNVEVYRVSNLPGDENRHTLPDPLPVGNYLVRVIAYDQNDREGDKSPPRRFSVVVPTPLLPGPITVDPTPLLEWSRVNAPLYDVEIREQVTNNTVEIRNSVVETSIEAEGLPDGDYFYRVRAAQLSGEVGHWSENLEFTVDTSHSLVAVQPEGNIVNRLPEFTWEGVDGVDEYQFILEENTGTNANPVWDRVLRQNGINDASYQLDTADRLDAGRYRWRVRYLNADGQFGSFTNTQFRVAKPRVSAIAGTDVSPGDNPTVNTSLPRINWVAASVMTSYEIRVDNVDLGINNVIRESGLTSRSLTPSEPLANWTFQVRVRGTDADGNVSQWSDIVLFTVDGAVGSAPVILSPDNGNFQPQSPTFNWFGIPSAFSYNILIKELRGSGQPLVVEVNGIAATNAQIQTHELQEVLPENRAYRWWVQAVDAAGQAGPFSAPGNFVTSADGVSAPAVSGQTESALQIGQTSVVATLGEQITIHPALPANAPVDNQTVTLKAVPAAPQVSQPAATPAEPIAPVSDTDAANVDSVMTGWVTEPVEMLGASVDPAAEEVEADSGSVDERLLFAAGLPLLFGKKRKNRKKNKKQ